jgi:hypothetical protein
VAAVARAVLGELPEVGEALYEVVGIDVAEAE